MTLLALQSARRALVRSWERKDVVFEGQHTRMVTFGDWYDLALYYQPPVAVTWTPTWVTS